MFSVFIFFFHLPKGKRINSTVKKIIYNVYDYFENKSKKCKGSIMKLGKKMVEATGCCKRTVGVIFYRYLQFHDQQM